jgi:hypothetical protein
MTESQAPEPPKIERAEPMGDIGQDTEDAPLLRGRSAHRRTQSAYMATLLDRVTLEVWGEVVDATVAAAKSGDTQARAWLAAYLLGKPHMEARSPLAVIVERISGNDELVKELAEPVIHRWTWPDDEEVDNVKAAIRAQVAAELAERIDGT